MLINLKSQLKTVLEEALKKSLPAEGGSILIELDMPADKTHGEFTTNIALKNAKALRKSPLVIAQEFVTIFEVALKAQGLDKKIAKMEVKAPGFINFFLGQEAFYEVIYDALKNKDNYGRLDFGQNKKVQIEFVSANPTGPLSVAHARQAAVGDALGNILSFIGFASQKEFYVNDEGNQINILGRSIKLRAKEILGERIEFPEDHYQGDYIKDMAQIFMDERKIASVTDLDKLDALAFNQFGVDYLLGVIKEELDDFGVHFDNWAHQSKVATNANIEKVVEFLRSKGFVYEKDGALWFKSTDFGDDKDRVVKKSDGQYTYLTPDIVYHKNKFERGFTKVLNLWGPDHHGYIPRIKAAAAALGYDPNNLEVLIVQLATIYRNGQVLSMSTRRGQYISLREVMQEVGVDAARFFFLMRHIEAHLEFDLELAKKQTPENPVYYIQYAHARVYSINKKADESGIKPKSGNLSLLKESEELELIKLMGSFSDILMFCYNKFDPFPLVNYMQDLATAFHRFYDKHRVIDDVQKELSAERLTLVNAARVVIANGLRLLGVSRPEKM